MASKLKDSAFKNGHISIKYGYRHVGLQQKKDATKLWKIVKERKLHADDPTRYPSYHVTDYEQKHPIRPKFKGQTQARLYTKLRNQYKTQRSNMTTASLTHGPIGTYGPNDSAYINKLIREAAQLLVNATYIFCEGHYPHSNARDIPANHPLCLALAALAEVDQETARFANELPWSPLFAPHRPTDDAKNRWNKPAPFPRVRQ